jgi:hypothetical protein
MFNASWASRKEDGNDYTFDSLCGFLIRAHDKLLDEGGMSSNMLIC